MIPAAKVRWRGRPVYVNAAAGPAAAEHRQKILALNLNQQVEGWVLGPVVGCGPGSRTHMIGWSYGRYLESFPVSAPRPTPKSPARKTTPQSETPKAPHAPKAM
jgi:hypothetical protein